MGRVHGRRSALQQIQKQLKTEHRPQQQQQKKNVILKFNDLNNPTLSPVVMGTDVFTQINAEIQTAQNSQHSKEKQEFHMYDHADSINVNSGISDIIGRGDVDHVKDEDQKEEEKSHLSQTLFKSSRQIMPEHWKFGKLFTSSSPNATGSGNDGNGNGTPLHSDSDSFTVESGLRSTRIFEESLQGQRQPQRESNDFNSGEDSKVETIESKRKERG